MAANVISFMTANFVAREVGYSMTGGWTQGDRAANEYFRPAATFPDRFEALLLEIRALGFTALDLWSAHLNWGWATSEHIQAARELLQRHGLTVVSLAGAFGATRAEFESACRMAAALGTGILGGYTALLLPDRSSVIDCLRAHGLKLGIENHPEKTPAEMLVKIGEDSQGAIGTTIDTGCYGTEGYDAAQATLELADHIVHVHLRDVRAPGDDESCRYGRGCVPLAACVRTLQQIGYDGAISVEHGPANYDPREDCRANLAMLRQWLQGTGETSAPARG